MMILSCWVRGIRGRWSRHALGLLLVLVAQGAKAPSPLADGIAQVEQGDYDTGVRSLTAAGKLLPQLSDYVDFYLAKAHFELKEYEPSIKGLESVLAASPASPLAGQAALLAARAYLESGAPQRAVEALKNSLSEAAAAGRRPGFGSGLRSGRRAGASRLIRPASLSLVSRIQAGRGSP